MLAQLALRPLWPLGELFECGIQVCVSSRAGVDRCICALSRSQSVKSIVAPALWVSTTVVGAVALLFWRKGLSVSSTKRCRTEWSNGFGASFVCWLARECAFVCPIHCTHFGGTAVRCVSSLPSV